MESSNIFCGVMPALMTPCNDRGIPDFGALVRQGQSLRREGMDAVVYCGSMGDWPLLTDEDRQTGVAALLAAGLPVVVGTGAQNTRLAVAHATHARQHGAAGLMIIPRVLSRGSSPGAQREHFAAILRAADGLPSVIYNSPYYGFSTGAALFFELREEFPHLVGFKEFGGAEALTAAAEQITSGHPDLVLMVGVDTQVYHGYVNCGARGAITGVGNALPREVLRLVTLCQRAAAGCVASRRWARELNEALHVLSSFDEGPDLVLYYKALMVLQGHGEYAYPLHAGDRLTASQSALLRDQWNLFRSWWDQWDGAQDRPGTQQLPQATRVRVAQPDH